MKPHRKLFPFLTSTNQSTQDCPYFCDQTCPYYCYPNHDFYNLLPPPPQPPHEHNISPFVIILVSVLASVFLLVSYYIISSKSCPFWPFHNGQPRGELDPTEDVENRVDHPIWFISTAGLQQSVINSITVCKYKKGEGLIEGTECSVCLSEFRQDETLRLLPKCSHAFHVPCIDTWLRSHTNCPLCRAHIVNANVPPLTAPNQNLEDPNTPANTQMENPETNRELGNFEPLQIRDAEEGERTMKEEVHQRDLGISYDVQTMRRSLSMNYLTMKRFENGVIETGNGAVESKKEGEKMGSSSIAQHLHMSPVAMKRSFSCGGRFFSSRQNRNLNSVFPL